VEERGKKISSQQ